MMHKNVTQRDQRGMALPVVLWIFLLLSLMFSGYGYSIRTETAMTQQLIEVNKTRAAAQAGVEFAVRQLISDLDGNEESSSEKVFTSSFDGINLRFAFINESGRIDLNTAPEELLDMLLQRVGVSVDEANHILHALQDWRDVDAERRDFGAEDQDYMALGLPYEAADTSLKSVDELMLIQGMTSELFEILHGMVTVHSEAKKINLRQAPQKLLMVLAGLGIDSTTENYPEQLDFNREELIHRLSNSLPADLLSSQVNDTYNIEVEASMQTGTKSRLSVIIRLVDSAHEPYTVLSWKEAQKLDFIF